MAQDELEGGKSTVRVWFESNKGTLMRGDQLFQNPLRLGHTLQTNPYSAGLNWERSYDDVPILGSSQPAVIEERILGLF